MKQLTNQCGYERPNAEALGAYNASVTGEGGIPTPGEIGFKKLPTTELVGAMNKNLYMEGYKFAEWKKGDKHRIYINNNTGPGPKGILYNTNKVKQTAYIDVSTGSVHVFTESRQPMSWNISQSRSTEKDLAKFGRYVRRFKND